MKAETITEQLYFTTVHIECENEKGPDSQGTGFIVDSERGLFIVTARHVVEDSTKGTLRFHIAKAGAPSLSQGKKIAIPEFKNYWVPHSNPDIDVAIMSLSLILEDARRRGLKYYFKSIPRKIFAFDETLKGLDAFEEVAFLGYPSGLYDKAHYLPVFRRGVTASPIYIDHDGISRFLLDGAVFAGSSGSPVFVYNKGFYSSRSGAVTVGDRLLFVGVLAEGYRDSQEGIPSPVRSEMLTIRDGQTINLGVVYKSGAIVDIIEKLTR